MKDSSLASADMKSTKKQKDAKNAWNYSIQIANTKKLFVTVATYLSTSSLSIQHSTQSLVKKEILLPTFMENSDVLILRTTRNHNCSQ